MESGTNDREISRFWFPPTRWKRSARYTLLDYVKLICNSHSTPRRCYVCFLHDPEILVREYRSASSRLTESVFPQIPGQNCVLIFSRIFFYKSFDGRKNETSRLCLGTRLSAEGYLLNHDKETVPVRKRLAIRWSKRSLTSHLPRAGPVSTRRACNAPHPGHSTYGEAYFLWGTGEGIPVCERYRYAVSVTESLAGTHGPILTLLIRKRGAELLRTSELLKIVLWHIFRSLTVHVVKHQFSSITGVKQR